LQEQDQFDGSDTLVSGNQLCHLRFALMLVLVQFPKKNLQGGHQMHSMVPFQDECQETLSSICLPQIHWMYFAILLQMRLAAFPHKEGQWTYNCRRILHCILETDMICRTLWSLTTHMHIWFKKLHALVNSSVLAFGRWPDTSAMEFIVFGTCTLVNCTAGTTLNASHQTRTTLGYYLNKCMKEAQYCLDCPPDYISQGWYWYYAQI